MPPGQNSSARVRFAAFGKHPGWDGFVDDLGAQSDTLAWAKKTLFTDGVAKVIEQGRWERLDEGRRQSGFRHVFFWRVADGLVVGRMWNSRDTQGRSQYPMVVCAHCQSVPVLWVMEHVVARLSALETKISQGTSQTIVRLALETAQGELDAASKRAGPAEDFPGAGSALQRLASHPDLAPEKGESVEPLARVLWEIEQRFSEFRPGKYSPRARCEHLRVPKCATRTGEAAREWVSLTDQELDRAAPVLVVEAVEERFADVIVGTPDAASMYCIRAGERAIGLNTERSVEVPEAFASGARKKIEAWKGGATVPAGRGNVAASPVAGVGPAPTRPAAAPERARAAEPVAGGGDGADAPPEPEPLRGGARRVRAAVGLGLGLALAGGMLYAFKRYGVATPSGTIAARPDPSRGARFPDRDVPVTAGPGSGVDTPANGSPGDAGTDPRPAWDAGARLKELQESYRRAATELLAAGERGEGEAVPGLGARLLAAERRIGEVHDAEWSAPARAEVLGEMKQVDGELIQLRHDLDGVLEKCTSRVREHLARESARATWTNAAVGRTFVDAVGAIDGSLGWDLATARAEALRESLRRIDEGLGELVVVAPPESMIDPKVLDRVLRAEREEAGGEAARECVAGGAETWGDGSRAITIIQASSEAREAWAASARRMIADANEIELLMSAGYALDETAPGAEGAPPRSIASIRREIAGSPALPRCDGAVGPILARVEQLVSLRTERDTEMIVGLVRFAGEATGPTRVSEVVGGWNRLSELEWPASEADLGQAAELLRESVLASVARVEPSRREALTRGVMASSRKCWWRYFAARAEGGAEFGAALTKMRALGVTDADLEQLPGWARYNVARWRLGERLGALEQSGLGVEAQTRQARGLASEFARSVEAFGANIRERPEVAALLARARGAREVPGNEDLRHLGPGAGGWRMVEADEDGSSVVFAPSEPGGGVSLTFRRLEGISGPKARTVTYLGTGEVSLGVFTEAVSRAPNPRARGLGRWPDVHSVMPDFDPRTDDPRAGPRVWTWNPSASWAWGVGVGSGRGEPMLAARGQVGDASNGWLRPMTRAGEAYYPAELFAPGEPSPPTPASPMQHVSPRAAVLMARIVGCRLPTSAEWRAAAQMERGRGGEKANVRDLRWKREFGHVAGLLNYAPEFPAGGIFWPLGMQHPTPAQDSESVTNEDDGWLWFAPASSGGSQFHHVLGNVAEFVFEDPARLESAGSDAPAVAAAVGRGEAVKVIGGSALSSPMVDPDVPQPVSFSQSLEGFSDVGFRLAFTAPEGAAVGEEGGASLVSGLKQALSASGYLSAPPGERVAVPDESAVVGER